MTITGAVLTTETGVDLTTQSGSNILVESELFTLPVGPPDVRITVLSPSANTVVARDASGDLAGQWQVQYEKTPGGCGSANVTFGLRYEECYERGYATAMNIFEISTGDDMLQASIAAGATKLYVTSYLPYVTTTNGGTQQQIYLWDGVNLTMRVPVTGGGQDSGGDYITVGSPLAGGGNPTTIPAYTAGPTIIGRRRYAGYVSLRERPKQNEPSTTITCVPLANIFNLSMGSYSFAQSANVDIGAAIYGMMSVFATPGGAGGFSSTLGASCAAGAASINVTNATSLGVTAGTYIMLDYGPPGGISERVLVASVAGNICTLVSPTQYAHANGATAQSQSRWPQFYLASANFPTIGETFVGSVTTTSVMQMLSNILGAISSGDTWSLIVDHDRIPRLQRLFTLSTDSYAFPVNLTQGQIDFEPMQITIEDQNASNIANAVLVTGNTNPSTNQPYNAIVVDQAAIAVYDGLQFDAQPVSVAGLGSDNACAGYGDGLLSSESIAQLQGTIRVYGQFANTPAYQPQSLPGGDAVDGFSAVYLGGFDQIGVSNNNCADSEFLSSNILTASSIFNFDIIQDTIPFTWLLYNLTIADNAGPAYSNALELTSSGVGMANSPNFYVGAGRSFILSMYVNATYVTSGTITISICTNLGDVQASVTVTNGTAGVVSTPACVLPAGVETCFVQISANATFSLGSVIFSQPMLADGSAVRSYVPNYGAPVVYGLVSSAATTIDHTGDRWQDIVFAPIEPDWSAEIQEQSNALAAQIRQNGPPATNISQYTVSTSFFPLSYSATSLVVTVPVALAIFAQGTTPVVVGGNTFTLPASAISWVWLNPNNTYTINQNGSTVAGAIMIGFFQTSSIGVDGFTQKASVGLVTLTQSQLPSMGTESTAAPVLTPGTPTITYPVYGNGTYDATATFSVDLDLATAPWMVALALFAVAAGYSGDPRDFPYGVVPCAEWSGFSVSPVWTGIGAGNSKDLYVAYQDGQGRYSLATKVGTTNANQAGASALLGVPTTPPNPTAAPSAFTYANNGAGTYDAECTVYLDSNGTTAANGLAEIECVMMPHATGAVNFLAPLLAWVLGTDTGYDSTNNRLYIVPPASTAGPWVTTQTFACGAAVSLQYSGLLEIDGAPGGTGDFRLDILALNASGGVISTIASTTTYTAAQSATPFSVTGTTPAGTVSVQARFYFEGTAGSSPSPAYLYSPVVQNLSATNQWTPSGNPQLVNSSGQYVCAWGGCGVQCAYDVGIRYVGQNGSRSNVYIVGTTTASQLAQLPFAGATVDPTTGYIVIEDQSVYPTTLSYAMPTSGIGSLLSASWAHRAGSTAVSPSVWLFYTSASGGNGYLLYWAAGTSYVYIYKCTAGAFTQIGISAATYTHDATKFHTLEFAASETTAGTITMQGMLDGNLVVSASDSSSPYTSGMVAAQFRDATAINYIDSKTIDIELGGSPSSSGYKGQGSLVPTLCPQFAIYIGSPTSTGAYPGMCVVETDAVHDTFNFPDGSSFTVPASTVVYSNNSGANGTWYVSVGYNVATGQWGAIFTQSTMTQAQLATYFADSWIPLTTNISLTVIAGVTTIQFQSPGVRSG